MANNALFKMAEKKRKGEKQPERHPDEHYATPLPAAQIMSQILFRYWWATRSLGMDLIDIGADEGVWGAAMQYVTHEILKNPGKLPVQFQSHIWGIEKRVTKRSQMKDDPHYREWIVGDATDFSNYADLYTESMIAFGNPPFLKEGQGRAMNDWLHDLIDHFAVVGFLLRTDFVGGLRHYNDLFRGGKLAVMAQSIHRIHFEGHGTNNYREFAFYIWDKRHKGSSMLTWFDHKQQTIDPYFLEWYK